MITRGASVYWTKIAHQSLKLRYVQELRSADGYFHYRHKISILTTILKLIAAADDHRNPAVLPPFSDRIKRNVQATILALYEFFIKIMLGQLPTLSAEEQGIWRTRLVNFLQKSPTL